MKNDLKSLLCQIQDYGEWHVPRLTKAKIEIDTVIRDNFKNFNKVTDLLLKKLPSIDPQLIEEGRILRDTNKSFIAPLDPNIKLCSP